MITGTIEGQQEIKELLEVACEDDLPTLLVGETGTGKTSLVRELAHEQKKTYTRFSITGKWTIGQKITVKRSGKLKATKPVITAASPDQEANSEEKRTL